VELIFCLAGKRCSVHYQYGGAGTLLIDCGTGNSTFYYSLFKEGQLVAKNGSHEAVVFHLVPPGGIAQAELMKVGFCLVFAGKE